jgi:D-amino peptidase
MHIVLIADMEGASGIYSKFQVFGKTKRAKPFGLRRMHVDVSAALHGLRNAGADKVTLIDWHHEGTNLKRSQLKVPRGLSVVWSRESWLPRALQKIKPRPDAAVIIGFHAMAGLKAILAHTYSFRIKKITVNGRSVGETYMVMSLFNRLGIPTCFISGSHEAVLEAKSINPSVRTVVTKKGLRVYGLSAVVKEINSTLSKLALRKNSAEAPKNLSAQITLDPRLISNSRQKQIVRFTAKNWFDLFVKFEKVMQQISNANPYPNRYIPVLGDDRVK